MFVFVCSCGTVKSQPLNGLQASNSNPSAGSVDVNEKEGEERWLVGAPEPIASSTRDATFLNLGRRTPGASTTTAPWWVGGSQIEEKIIITEVMDSRHRLLPDAACWPSA